MKTLPALLASTLLCSAAFAGEWVNISDTTTAPLKPGYGGPTAGVTVDRASGDVFFVVSDLGLWRSSDHGATFARCDEKNIGGRCETGLPARRLRHPFCERARLLVQRDRLGLRRGQRHAVPAAPGLRRNAGAVARGRQAHHRFQRTLDVDCTIRRLVRSPWRRLTRVRKASSRGSISLTFLWCYRYAARVK